MQKNPVRSLLRRGTALALAALMALTVSLLPAGAVVTQQDINNLKSKAQSLNNQKAQIQSQLNKLASSKNIALQE